MSSRLAPRVYTIGHATSSFALRRRRPDVVKRLLVAHHLLLGDTLMLTPLLKKARARFPDAEIVMTAPRRFAPLYAGKPYGPIYDMALAWLGEHRARTVEKAQVLAIGDGVRTDILGAARAGIASVYIASGVSMPKGGSLDADTLASMFDDPAVQPIAAMAELAW